MQFIIDGEPTELASVPFTIGGKAYDVPILNLEANEVALDLLPKASGASEQAEAALKVIEARMRSVDGSTLTADFIRKRLVGMDEMNGLQTGMMKLLEISGLYKPAEGNNAGEAPAAGDETP